MRRWLLVLAMWLAVAGAAFAQVNINTANKDQLDGLKGIGPAKAQAIIDYRTKNGPFKTVDDLQKVPGIGPATMKQIRGDLTVTGASAPAKAAKAEKTEKASKKGEAKEPAKVDAKKEKAEKKAKKGDTAKKEEAKKEETKSDKK
jgi:competence protein ComEA